MFIIGKCRSAVTLRLQTQRACGHSCCCSDGVVINFIRQRRGVVVDHSGVANSCADGGSSTITENAVPTCASRSEPRDLNFCCVRSFACGHASWRA